MLLIFITTLHLNFVRSTVGTTIQEKIALGFAKAVDIIVFNALILTLLHARSVILLIIEF